MKKFFKPFLALLTVTVLLISAVLPGSAADNVAQLENPLDNAVVNFSTYFQTPFGGAFSRSYSDIPVDHFANGIYFKSFFNDTLDGSYSYDLEYISRIIITLNFQEPLPISRAGLYFNSASPYGGSITVTARSTEGLLYTAIVSDAPEALYKEVAWQPFGDQTITDDIRFSSVELTIYWFSTPSDPYDRHIELYNFFKTLPFSIFYDFGDLSKYTEGYYDGLAYGKILAEKRVEEALKEYRSEVNKEISNLEKYYKEQMDIKYQEGYTAGEQVATNQAKQVGFDEGYEVGFNEGGLIGYQNGINDAENANFNGDFKTLFFTVLDAPVSIVRGFLNFDFLGVNLLGFFSSIITIALFAFILKKII